MLGPELRKLKDMLEGKSVKIDKRKLLTELKVLDSVGIRVVRNSSRSDKGSRRNGSLNRHDFSAHRESYRRDLAPPRGVCPTCGKKL